MNFIGHIITSFLISIILIGLYMYYYEPILNLEFFTNCILFISIAIISSMIPDLDMPESTFFKIVELIVIGIIAFLSVSYFGWTQEALLIGLGSVILFKLFSGLIIPKHRGFIHSWAFMGVVAILLMFYFKIDIIVYGFLVGFLSHLLGDGIPFKIL